MSRYYDPCDGSRVVKWRWRIAGGLNRLPRTCWANLVSWALGNRPLLDRNGDGDIRQNSLCGFDLSRNGSCYCGKLRTPTSEDSTP